jgi:hypothetical protein
MPADLVRGRRVRGGVLILGLLRWVRRFGEKRAFYLPPGGFLDGEHYVDFRVITTIRRQTLEELTRVASMNDEGRLLLRAHLFRFFTRRTLPPDWLEWPEGGRMKLDFAMLASDAAAVEGRLYIHGGGLRSFDVPRVPWVEHLAVAAKFTADIDEINARHVLELAAFTPGGRGFFPAAPIEVRLGTEHVDPDWTELGVIVAVRIAALAFSETGWYMFELYVDSEPVTELPLRFNVIAPPELPHG